MKQCNNCGAFIDDNAQFCTSCGTPCNQTIVGTSPSGKNYHIWYYIVGGLSVVVIAILAGVFLYNNKTEAIQSPTEAAAPVSDRFQNEVNGFDDGIVKDNVETNSEYYNGYEIKFSDAVKAFYEEGLWGLKNYYGEVILTPRYKEITYDRPIVVGMFHDGKYDLIEGGRVLFETPIDSYCKDEHTIDVTIGNRRYLYFLSTMYKAGPIKDWRYYGKHNEHVMCRLTSDDLLICNDMGSNRIEIANPICIKNDEINEHFIVYKKDANHYHFYNMDEYQDYSMSGIHWNIMITDYLIRDGQVNPFFDVMYNYSKGLSEIFKELKEQESTWTKDE